MQTFISSHRYILSNSLHNPIKLHNIMRFYCWWREMKNQMSTASLPIWSLIVIIQNFTDIVQWYTRLYALHPPIMCYASNFGFSKILSERTLFNTDISDKTKLDKNVIVLIKELWVNSNIIFIWKTGTKDKVQRVQRAEWRSKIWSIWNYAQIRTHHVSCILNACLYSPSHNDSLSMGTTIVDIESTNVANNPSLNRR